ncbi:hypothetical protein BDZ45DRAFT_420272 [Acephala macrosclerotiorum]|nr:hypothetical protein BDZ45DRAFT_420272 [Acephala macrosclerotiorum]
MAIPYTDAISILDKFAAQKAKHFAQEAELVPITSAVGRISRDAYYNPTSTPAFDSSAMDGYAVNSASISTASPTKPIIFRVRGMIAAGDAPISVPISAPDCFLTCVAVKTGARFPLCTQTWSESVFDACIKVEDTPIVLGPDLESRYTRITKPAKRDQNRRVAGSDFQHEDLIIGPGTAIKVSHVMALAALGTNEVKGYRKLRIGIMSTGKEVVPIHDSREYGPNQVRDSNGPYIEALLTGLGVEVTNLGVVDDDPKAFDVAMTVAMECTEFDVIVTTGAVSMGKFDFVSQGLALMTAQILFHKIAMRPGHPALFAKLPVRHKGSADDATITPPASPVGDGSDETAFFGLPGVPVAAAACVRFLVYLYLRALHGFPAQGTPKGITAILNSNESLTQESSKKPLDLQVYWHGKYNGQTGQVTVSPDQSSNKIKPLLDANCWVGVEPGTAFVGAGGKVEVHDMYPPSLGS